MMTSMLATLLAARLLAQTIEPPREGKPAPDFSVRDSAGAPITLSSLKGKPAVLFFFCSCNACKEVGQAWGQLQRAGQTTPTYISYEGDFDEAKAYRTANMVTATLLDGLDESLAEKYQALPCPAAFVIDPQGKLAYSSKQSAGVNETRASALTRQLADTLEGRRTSARSDLPAWVPSDYPFAAVEGNGLKQESLGVISYRVKAVSTDKARTVEHEFMLRNVSQRPVTITMIEGSCGCVGPFLNTYSDKPNGATFAPGDTFGVVTPVELKKGATGIKQVRVYLYGDGKQVVQSLILTIPLLAPGHAARSK